MKFVEMSYEILTPITGDELKSIERAARTCYKSEARNEQNDPDKTKRFISSLIKNGHCAMLEHSQLSVKFIVDRGISHELVRHRVASFAQESTRYCNYGDKDIEFIIPSGLWAMNNEVFYYFSDACREAEDTYKQLLKLGVEPQIARAVLPNCLKTEVVMTANYREWRYFFELRALGKWGKPHPDMAFITSRLLRDLKCKIPVIFDDLEV